MQQRLQQHTQHAPSLQPRHSCLLRNQAFRGRGEALQEERLCPRSGARTCVQVRALAQRLFDELAKKQRGGSNPVAALVPDILSNLAADADLSAKCFRDIMAHILPYAAKDKCADSLAGRVAARLAPTAGLRAARLFVGVLAQLKPSAKVLAGFEENLPQWRHFLADKEFAGAVKVRRP